MNENEIILQMDEASAGVTANKKLHIYEVENVYSDSKGVHYELSKHSVAWDIGMAWYHYEWTSAYTLMGFMRTIMGEAVKSEMLDTVRAKHCNVHAVKHGQFMVVWEGQWTLLEKVGFLHAIMTPANLQNYTLDVQRRAKPGGAVPDRG